MAERLSDLTINDGTYRMQLVEVGARVPRYVASEKDHGDEQIVPVALLMPLADAQRFGANLFEWFEVTITQGAPKRDDPAQTR